MTCRDVDVFYADKQAIFNVSLDIGKNEVIALIGPQDAANPLFCDA
jgi:phosphate transport system ATP-binding protein